MNTLEMLERLVAFDTTSSKSNLDLIDYVQTYLEGVGATIRRVSDPTGTKAALHAVLGDPTGGGIAFSGHVDTVPVDGQAWTGNPFKLRQQDGKLYGRGAVDMKGFVASCLAAAPDLLSMRLRHPVHFLISYDEEVDGNGARRITDDIRPGFWKPDMCVVGEPTGMSTIVAHKAKLVARGKVTGLSGHSSQPGHGVNAVQAAAAAVTWAASLAANHAGQGPFDTAFDPPYSTVHVGKMWGGTIVNIIPEEAGFVMEWRTIPADDAMAELESMRRYVAGALEPAMKAIHAAAGIELSVDSWYPGLSLSSDHPLVSLVTRATGISGTGNVSYATEAGIFLEAGIPTLVCGPGHIAQAHKPDEWIAESELAACDKFIRAIATSATEQAVVG
jgi:acetylornithine deacetylase